MPDAHEGYGMPIGGVIASQRAVIPNAVGVDIGCGMCAVKTSLTVPNRESLKRMMTLVRERIPLGFNHRKQKVNADLLPALDDDEAEMPVVTREYEEARTQLGTLGGGNHFVEFQADTGGTLWLMIHSGSRNLGKQVADHYNSLAVDIDRKRHAPLPKEWQLAWLEVDSDQGRSYLAEMQYCVDFALANRRMMMDVLTDIVQEEHGGNAGFEPAINIAHNYAVQESHFGRHVWVHRKGATLATADTEGIIPGSQGTPSYIVRGKGNAESFQSCSHGAGRRLGRKQARRELDLHAEQQRLEAQGILHSVRSRGDLDEAAGAYKDIAEVMANQRDLVEVAAELRPLAVIKG
jgi:tRNA-splicing ligase RtcB